MFSGESIIGTNYWRMCYSMCVCGCVCWVLLGYHTVIEKQNNGDNNYDNEKIVMYRIAKLWST